MMEIFKIDKAKLKDLSTVTLCDINCIHIKVKDFKQIVKDFEKLICDTMWINKLDELSQIAIRNNVEKTVKMIMEDIIAKVDNDINVDIGEYIVSYCGQHALEIECSHTKIPLAELFKDRIAGNGGFDFHTICQKKYLIFGEAKFSIDGTPRAKALDQIVEFIGDRDKSDLLWLKEFLDEETSELIKKGEKGYAAAFSFNGLDIVTIFNNALESDPIESIGKHKELYLIAVEIC